MDEDYCNETLIMPLMSSSDWYHGNVNGSLQSLPSASSLMLILLFCAFCTNARLSHSSRRIDN